MTNSLTYFQATGVWQDLEINLPVLGDVDPHAEVENISAFVDFIPRLPVGKSFLVQDLITQQPQNSIQQMGFNGVPTAGTFKLGTDPSHVSGAIAYNANATTIRDALAALSTVGVGNVTVTGSGPFQIQFIGALAATPMATLLADYSLLTGATVEMSFIQAGKPQVTADTAVHLDKFTGRLTNGVLCTPAEEDVPGVYLLANSPILNYMDTTVSPPVPATLIYDVRFRNVIYGPLGDGNLQNFAFAAPTDATPVDLTDPNFVRLPYAPLPTS